MSRGFAYRRLIVGVGVVAALGAACGQSTPRLTALGRELKSTPTSYRVTLDDPAGDDRGPGTYVYPQGNPFPAGTFDLRAVTIAERGEDLEVTVQIRGEFREWPYAIIPYSMASALPQVIDVYIDEDGVRGSGMTRALPGRGIVMPPESAWEKVLVIASRSVVDTAIAADADPETGKRAVIPTDLRIAGDRLIARFPIAQTGRPTPRWGYTVAMFGTSYTGPSEIARRVRAGDGAGYVRDVRKLAGACSSVDDPGTAGCSFGGCAPCIDHPRVIDLIVPPGRDQKQILSAYRAGKPASVPAVYPFGPPSP